MLEGYYDYPHARLHMPKIMSKKDLFELVDKIAENRKGQLDEMESAVGMLILGRHFGWKVLYLIHSKQTIKKYEEILEIKDIRDVLPDVGLQAKRSQAWRALQGVTNFWKAVKGEIKNIKTMELT